MKAFLGATLLAAAILGALVWKAVGASSAREDLESRRLADSALSTGAAFDAVIERLEKLEGRLDSLERQASNLERAVDRAPASAAEVNSELKEGDAVAEGASLADESGEKEAKKTPRIKGMDDEDMQELRALIAQVYIDERNQRKVREQEAAEQAAREREEMMKGPYGENNYRVNSLAKKLGLSDYQKGRYNDLLTAHRQRLMDLRAGLNLSDAAARDSLRDRMRQADEDFQSTVLTFLSAEQAEAYAALDEGERSGGDMKVMFTRAMKVMEAAGGQASFDFVTVQGGVDGVPVPPDAIKGGLRIPVALPGAEAGIVIEAQPGGEVNKTDDPKPRVIQVKPAK